MAAVDSLRTHLVDELKDLRSAEQQLIDALPKLARSATSKQLSAAFQKHLRETRVHLTRLDKALRALGETPASKTCEGMQGLIDEGETVMNKTPAGPLRDAVMITGAQKVEHYEMASYGTARTYANVLGETAVARLLQQTLREEKAADVTLTKIAEGSVNERAAEEWSSKEEQGLMQRSAQWVAGAMGWTAGAPTKEAPRTRGTRSTRGGQRMAARKRSSSRRELINTGTDKRYVRRTASGQFKESDDIGRSLAQDRTRKATKRAKRGQGDRGDRTARKSR